MLEKEGAAWFFKLTGDKSLVESSEKEFDEFIGSFMFEEQQSDPEQSDNNG